MKIIHFAKMKYTPARENDQNSPKNAKWLKITFRVSKVPKVSKWGFLGGVFVMKSDLRILIRAPEVPFLSNGNKHSCKIQY